MSDIKPNTRGLLYALAIGDAYGVGFEFMEPLAIKKQFSNPPQTSIGGGPFDFAPGEFSDDTEMAVLTIASLQKHQNLDLEHIKKLYMLWAPIAKDIGTQTRYALVDNELDPNGEGNGALMRILPAAAYMYETLGWNLAQIKENIRHISALTHDNDTVHEINEFFIDLMFGNSMEPYASLIKRFHSTKGNNAWVLNTARIIYKIYSLGNISLMDGFWEIIRYGGDTDTACAIYGAIRGYQEPDIVTPELIKNLLSHSSISQLEQFESTQLYHYIPQVSEPSFIAGQYPGSSGRITHVLKMGDIIDLEIDTIVNLMEIEELKRFTPYQNALRLVNPNLIINTIPIRDMDIPRKGILEKILAKIDQNLEEGKRVYIHCWGGHGRTGTVVGSWLVKHGYNGTQALEQIKQQRLLTPFGDAPSPQTPEQIEVIQRLSNTLGRR